jgi:Fructose-bisphosphate aldolase class-II
LPCARLVVTLFFVLQFSTSEVDMPLVSMRQLLDHAAENGYGIPAFNVNNLEQVQAVMQAADEVGAPVILRCTPTSPW